MFQSSDESSDDEVFVAAVAAAVGALTAVTRKKSDKRKGRPWHGKITKERNNSGQYKSIIPKLITTNDDLAANRVGTFVNYFRLSRPEFDLLLSRCRHAIVKQDTLFRESISPEQRLMITLRYLATGASMTSLHYSWCVGVATISQIIHETCIAIYEGLKDAYLKTPTDPDSWKAISEPLEQRWNFPNALGAIDGKHVVTTKPYHAGSEYHNYKGTESIILMALCDANYKFTYVDVGAQGRASDGGVYRQCSLEEAISNGSIQLPEARSPDGTSPTIPYTFVADEAFPLKEYIMRPFPQRTLNTAEEPAIGYKRKVFNYRLSRCRRLIENCFGILTNTWRILTRKIDLEPEKVQNIVLACCCLHNLLRSSRTPPAGGAAPPSLDDTGIDVPVLLPDINNLRERHADAVAATRNRIVNYVNGPGAVPWQYRAAGVPTPEQW